MDNQPNGSVGSAPQSQEPVVQSAPVQTQQPMPQQMASPASTSGGSKAMYIVGGIVAAILLVLGGLFLWQCQLFRLRQRQTSLCKP